jgi:hypothetical protein
MEVTTLDKVPNDTLFAMENADGYAMYIAGNATNGTRKCQRLTKKYDVIFSNLENKLVILPPMTKKRVWGTCN